MIKAIETTYNNISFRSRLEARWAFWFDQLNIKYEYEPQSFVLSDGSTYIPDFYLPSFESYAEVKPDWNDETAYDTVKSFRKLVLLFTERGRSISLLIGKPSPENFRTINKNAYNSLHESIGEEGVRFDKLLIDSLNPYPEMLPFANPALDWHTKSKIELATLYSNKKSMTWI